VQNLIKPLHSDVEFQSRLPAFDTRVGFILEVMIFMAVLKKIGKFLLDLLEIVIPSLLFLVIFLVFLISIVSRYFFRQPVPWTYEVSILAFMWTAYFACGYVMRQNEHVAFSMLYDIFPPQVQKICNLMSNALVALGLLVSIPPCLNSLLQNVSITGVLKFPFKYAFLPFIVMMADIMVRSIYNLMMELKNTTGDDRPQDAAQEKEGGSIA
jgi:TRAP-type C4-dicarboxylate transport system permease small subunit